MKTQASLRIILLMLICLFGMQAYAQSQNFLDKPYLETTASYTTDVSPDRIHLHITIDEKDTKGKTSMEELENRMISGMKAAGIDIEKQLTVLDLSSDFKKYFLKKTDVLKSKEYKLIAYSAGSAARVLKNLEAMSISNVQLEKTEYSKMEELKIELRGNAVAKAKSQATSLLAPLGQQVGKALFVQDQNTFDQNPLLMNFYANSRMYTEESPEAPNLGMAEMKVRVEVKVFFEIL